MSSFAPSHAGSLTNRSAARTQTVIVVVDPRAADYEAWMKDAQAAGVRLHVLASAEEALRLARTTGVDLWVVSTELPGLSGFELCGMLKARDGRTPVFLIADEYSAAAERQAFTQRASFFGVKSASAFWVAEWLARRTQPAAERPSFI
jgi:CheY-like chemotaxis protein